MTLPPDDRGRRRQRAAELAEHVLPSLDDLLGDGWQLEDDEPHDRSDAGEGSGLPDACLPPAFPDRAVDAGADVAFVLPGEAGVYAMSTVFDEPEAASLGWSLLRGGEFVQCFVASIAADVRPSGDTELLGPIMRPGRDGGGTTPLVGADVAVFSSINGHAAVPIELRVAVVGAGLAVVIVWAVDRGGAEVDRRWDHLVDRVARRCEAASA